MIGSLRSCLVVPGGCDWRQCVVLDAGKPGSDILALNKRDRSISVVLDPALYKPLSTFDDRSLAILGESGDGLLIRIYHDSTCDLFSRLPYRNKFVQWQISLFRLGCPLVLDIVHILRTLRSFTVVPDESSEF